MKVKVVQSCLALSYPLVYTVHGILQARILEWVAVPFSRGSSQSRIKPRSPALQVDSLPAEPPGKPKNTRVGSLSLLQWIFRPRNWTGISCIAGGFFTNWAIREALSYLYIDLFCFDCFIWKPGLHNWVTLAQEFCYFKSSLHFKKHLGLFLHTFSQINFFISFFKNPFGKFVEIILNLYINLGRPDVLTMLDFPIHEYGISDYLDLL